MGQRRDRPRRSAGTVGFLDVLRNRFRSPSRAVISADIAAVDRGEARMVSCLFRSLYGAYPRRFRARMLDLTPLGPVVRPYWFSVSRARFPIEEPVASASVRRRNPRTDWNVRATGIYAPGGILAHAGSEVIRCQTSLGILEFAVPRPDVPLVLHYLNGPRPSPDPGNPPVPRQ